jgi:hypothetical protein
MTDIEFVHIGDGVYVAVTDNVGFHQIILKVMRDGAWQLIYLEPEMLDTIKKLVANATKLPQP